MRPWIAKHGSPSFSAGPTCRAEREHSAQGRSGRQTKFAGETVATCAGRLLHDEVVVDLADPVDLGGDAPGAVLGGLRVQEAAPLHLAMPGGDGDLKQVEENGRGAR